MSMMPCPDCEVLAPTGVMRTIQVWDDEKPRATPGILRYRYCGFCGKIIETLELALPPTWRLNGKFEVPILPDWGPRPRGTKDSTKRPPPPIPRRPRVPPPNRVKLTDMPRDLLPTKKRDKNEGY